MRWKTTMTLLLGLAAQGCGFSDFYREKLESQVEKHLARTADRMAQHEDLRNLAYYPEQSKYLEDDKQYEHTARKIFKRAGQAGLKAGWKALTQNTSIEGIIEPSFKEDDENLIPTFSEPAAPEQPRQHSRYKLGFMPVLRVGDEAGGGIKARNFTVLALKGDDYWEYKANATIMHFRIAAEYTNNEIEPDKYKFGIGKGHFSLSFSSAEDGDKQVWLEFYK